MMSTLLSELTNMFLVMKFKVLYIFFNMHTRMNGIKMTNRHTNGLTSFRAGQPNHMMITLLYAKFRVFVLRLWFFFYLNFSVTSVHLLTLQFMGVA